MDFSWIDSPPVYKSDNSSELITVSHGLHSPRYLFKEVGGEGIFLIFQC